MSRNGWDTVKEARELIKGKDDSVFLEPYKEEGGVYRLSVDLREIDPFLAHSGRLFLDEGIFTYVDSFRKAMPSPSPIAIDFIVAALEEKRDADIEKAFRRHYRLELSETKRECRHVRLTSILMLIVGAILMGIYLFFSFGELGLVYEVIAEIVSIASWVFIWAAVEKAFFDLHELKVDALYYSIMSLTEIRFRQEESPACA